MAIAALAGLLMAVQGSINSAFGKVTGLIEATLVVHTVGALTTAALLLAGLRSGQLARLGEASWWMYLGGVIGVGITYGVARTIPQVGAAAATTAIIVGQVATAAFIDHFGLFGLKEISFSWVNALGLGLLATGAFLLLR